MVWLLLLLLPPLLLLLLLLHWPQVQLIEKFQMTQAFVFVRTQLDADNLESFLVAMGGGSRYTGKAEKGKENPYSCVVLHGGRSHGERLRNLEAFKDGDVRLLVCTDVAARGLDIVGMPFCINLTLPDKSEDYIHRVGRVGRADMMGLAISFVATCREKVWFYDKRKWAGKRLSTALATVGKGGNPTGGGCCIWYDEPRLLQQVQQRLGGISVEEMGPDMCLPEGKRLSAYGESKEGAAASAPGHLEELQEPLARLKTLELDVMASYYGIQQKFGVK